MLTIYTIGYTKKNLEEFVSLLEKYNIDKIIDVRLKNTSQLSGFAKKEDLKYILEELLYIDYIHEPKLAPTEEILDKYKDDKIWDEYVNSFQELMKDRKMDKVLDKYIQENENICLLCSEHKPDKCHRRLLAEYYKESNKKVKINHLTG